MRMLIKKIGLGLMSAAILAACSAPADNAVSSVVVDNESSISEVVEETKTTDGYDLSFSADDLETGYDEETATTITLSDGNSRVDGSGAAVSGDVVTISEPGDYVVTGRLTDGQIVVNAAETADVHLVFQQVSIHSSTSAPLLITESDKVTVTLSEGSENLLSDAETSSDQVGDSSVDGAIYSKADLVLNGSGLLTIEANYKHGIVSKDDLRITSGNYDITAKGQGLSGKDAVKIKSSQFTLTTEKDGIQSDNAEEAGRGFVYIETGDFLISSQGDAIQAENLLQIDGGHFEIETAGGSDNGVDHTESMQGFGGFFDNSSTSDSNENDDTSVSSKGLKAGQSLVLNGGELIFNTADDAIHSNGDVSLLAGDVTIESGDDGIHGDGHVWLNGTSVTITKSYEGIEGSTVTVDDGVITVTASDDGINVAGGNDDSSLNRPGANPFESNEDNKLIINGGKLVVDAQGDGLYSNGTTTINGGEIQLSGPENSGNGTLDAAGGTTIAGGRLVGAGSSGMAEGFTADSTQANVLYNLDEIYAAGSVIKVKAADGTVLLSWTAAKTFSSLIFSSADLVVGDSYTIMINETEIDLTLEDTVTSNGNGMGDMGGMGGPSNRPPGE